MLCRVGPSRRPRYALLDEWLGAPPAALQPDAALAELARRHLGAHGPAAPADLAAWSGAGLRRARRGYELIASELRAVRTAAGPAWALAGAPARPPRSRALLLGHFDPYLLGWESRDLVLDARFAGRIQAGGGFIQPALLVDGRVAGTWRRRGRAARLQIELEPFEELPAAALAALERDADDVGRFLGFRPDRVRTSVRT